MAEEQRDALESARDYIQRADYEFHPEAISAFANLANACALVALCERLDRLTTNVSLFEDKVLPAIRVEAVNVP